MGSEMCIRDRCKCQGRETEKIKNLKKTLDKAEKVVYTILETKQDLIRSHLKRLLSEEVNMIFAFT